MSSCCVTLGSRLVLQSTVAAGSPEISIEGGGISFSFISPKCKKSGEPGKWGAGVGSKTLSLYLVPSLMTSAAINATRAQHQSIGGNALLEYKENKVVRRRLRVTQRRLWHPEYCGKYCRKVTEAIYANWITVSETVMTLLAGLELTRLERKSYAHNHSLSSLPSVIVPQLGPLFVF